MSGSAVVASAIRVDLSGLGPYLPPRDGLLDLGAAEAAVVLDGGRDVAGVFQASLELRPPQEWCLDIPPPMTSAPLLFESKVMSASLFSSPITSMRKSLRLFAKSQTCEPTAPSMGPGMKIGTFFSGPSGGWSLVPELAELGAELLRGHAPLARLILRLEPRLEPLLERWAIVSSGTRTFPSLWYPSSSPSGRRGRSSRGSSRPSSVRGHGRACPRR